MSSLLRPRPHASLYSDNHWRFPLFRLFVLFSLFHLIFIFFPITLMGKQYTIEIQTETLNCSFLQRGYIKCDVSRKSTPLVKRHFLSCLHCSTLGSPSWFLYSKPKLDLTRLPTWSRSFVTTFIDLLRMMGHGYGRLAEISCPLELYNRIFPQWFHHIVDCSPSLWFLYS